MTPTIQKEEVQTITIEQLSNEELIKQLEKVRAEEKVILNELRKRIYKL